MAKTYRGIFVLLAVVAVFCSVVPAGAHPSAVMHAPDSVGIFCDFGPRYGTTYIATGYGGYEADALPGSEPYPVAYYFGYRVRSSAAGSWSGWSSDARETSCGSGWGRRTMVTGNWVRGTQVQFRARVQCAQSNSSAWTAGSVLTVGNTLPTTPTGLTYSPLHPTGADAIVGNGSGGGDVDGDGLGYMYSWYRHVSGDSYTWVANGDTLPASVTQLGQVWKLRCWAYDGSQPSTVSRDVLIEVGNATPTPPTALTINPASPRSSQAITATATGGTDGDNTAVITDPITYEYSWAFKNGKLWSKYETLDGRTLAASRTTKGQIWKVRARTADSHGAKSAFIYTAEFAIRNALPTAPAVALTPSPANENQTLTATASGGADGDGDALTYEYRWARNNVIQLNSDRRTVTPAQHSPGQTWRAQARCYDGSEYSSWATSNQVTLTDVEHAPTVPKSVVVTPARPRDADPLSAVATGSLDADGDAISYLYEWQVSLSPNGPWTSTGITTNPLVEAATSVGQCWRVRVHAHAGTLWSNLAYSNYVLIAPPNRAPSQPTLCSLSPATPTQGELVVPTAEGSSDPDGDNIEYRYDFQVDPEGDGTWQDWAAAPNLPTGGLPPGAKIRARGRAYDGELYGTPRWSQIVTVRGLVSAITPNHGATAVYRGAYVVVHFRQPVDQASAQAALYFRAGAVNCAHTVIWTTAQTIMRVKPVSPLLASTQYQIGFNGPIARAGAGNVTAPFNATFTTNNGPVVLSREPSGQNVDLSRSIVITFDQAMPPDCMRGNLVAAPALGPGSWSWNAANTVVTFDPTNPLAPGTRYELRVRGRCAGINAVPMNQDVSWWFETVPARGAAAVTASAGATAQGAAISVSLGCPARVQVTISNLAGRPIAVLPEASLPAGISSLTWNGRTLSGVKAPAGMYLVKVAAREANGGQVAALAPLQLR